MYQQLKFDKIAKTFYDGLDNGVFKGLRCPKCGKIEFPPYPACNSCGNVGNEWVELAGDVVINEVYSISPMMTIPEFMPFAPLFSAEVTFDNGPDLSCLIFGVTKQNYAEIRDSVPLKGKMVVMPMEGYNTFAVAINGATPIRKESSAGVMNQEKLISVLAQKKESNKGPPAVDGVYNFVAKAMGRTNNGKLTIIADGENLTGLIDIMDETAALKNGKLIDGNFEFTFEARGADMKFSGTLGGGKISGSGKFGAIKLKLEGERE